MSAEQGLWRKARIILFTDMGRSWLFLLLFVLVSVNLHARPNPQWGILPSVNINKRLPKDWSVNFKAESRQIIYRDSFRFTYSLTDVSLIAATRIRLRTTIGGGYLARISENGIRHRAIQQISISRNYPSFRLSHRISMDQSFGMQNPAEFRFRYRLSSEIPLQGQSLDPGEFFLKLSNEYLNAFQENDYDLEVRTAAYLGYALSPAGKLELGLDHRANSFISGYARHRFWIGLNYFYTLKD